MRIEVKHIMLFGEGYSLIISGLRVTIPVLLIFVSSYSYSQSIETITNSRPITIGGSVALNDNLEFLSDSVGNYYC